MGIVYRHVPAYDAIVTVYDQRVTHADADAFIARARSDPQWPLVTRRLIDTTSADFEEIGEEDVDALRVLWSDYARTDGVQIATVATDAWDLSRYAENLVREYGGKNIVFNDVATACTWLNLDVRSMREIIEDIRHEIRDQPS
jgi:hypothetical protein